MMWGIENALVVFESRCNSGVWQGDPLGAHCMGLAIYDFLEQLQAELQPGSAFEVSNAMHCWPHGTPYAWIIDDLTCVPHQYKAIAVIDWIMAEALKHGLHCNMPKFHVWITGRPEGNVSFVEALDLCRLMVWSIHMMV